MKPDTHQADVSRKMPRAGKKTLMLALAPIAAVLVVTVSAIASERAGAGRGSDVRGVVRAVQQATFSIDLNVRAKNVSVRPGSTFSKDDVLIVFDCARERAEMAAAQARHKEMRLKVASNRYLAKRRAAGKFELQVSTMQAQQAGAQADAYRARLKQCRIVAPFDGRVNEIGINAHELAQPGKPLLSVVGAAELELEFIVPSKWLRWLRPGQVFSFKIDETGATVDGRIIRIGAAVDPVSQTIRVFGRPDAENETPKLLPGMSGTAAFTARQSL